MPHSLPLSHFHYFLKKSKVGVWEYMGKKTKKSKKTKKGSGMLVLEWDVALLKEKSFNSNVLPQANPV